MSDGHGAPTELPAEDPAYRTVHDGSSELSETVVDAIVAATDHTLETARPLLQDGVDPESLDRVFDDKYDGMPRSGGQLRFPVGDVTVVVTADGVVEVYRRDR